MILHILFGNPGNKFLEILVIFCRRSCIIEYSFRKWIHVDRFSRLNNLNSFLIFDIKVTGQRDPQNSISWLQSVDSSIMVNFNDALRLDMPVYISLIHNFKLFLSPIIITAVKENLNNTTVTLLYCHIVKDGKSDFSRINSAVTVFISTPEQQNSCKNNQEKSYQS